MQKFGLPILPGTMFHPTNDVTYLQLKVNTDMHIKIDRTLFWY